MSTPFIRFPGVAGNNVSTPDLNILDSDSAHFEQSAGKWVDGGNSSLSLSGAWSVYGSQSLQIDTAVDAQVTAVALGTNNFPVTVGNTYTAASTVLPVGMQSRTLRMELRWRDAGGATLSFEIPAAVPVTDGVPLVVSVTGVAPSSAAFVDVRIVAVGSTGVTGTLLRADAVILQEGTSTVFTPSLQIVGSSFVDEDASVTPVTFTYTPGNPLVLGDGYAGDVRSWALHDGPDAAALIVAQVLATDALRALPL